MKYVLLFLYLLVSVRGQLSNRSGTCQTPNQQPGTCLLAKMCKTMSDFLETIPKPIPSDIKQKLKDYKCGVTSNNKPKICCPPTPISFDQSEINLPDVSNHRHIELIPKDCGYFDNNKIVNGNRTGILEFPWMALLSYRRGESIDFKCGGTIINQKYILTAAHCVTNLGTLKLVGVRIGEHNINTDKDCEEDEDEEETCAPPVQDLSIETVTFHEDYNTNTHFNDIALLRVSPIDLTQENTQPVCLPLGESRNFDYGDRNVVVTGWGITEKGSRSNVLLKAELPHIPLPQCQKKYTKLRKLNSGQLCAGGVTDSDSCGGDSGGPLHALAFLHGQPRFIQRGIVSFGPQDCGRVSIPGVYTRVASYMGWILDNIRP